MEYDFSIWLNLRENSDPFRTLTQKQGEIVYFGIHDLSKYYKQNHRLPILKIHDLKGKLGVIFDADPIDQIVKVTVTESPFNYGYRKLETDKDKMKRFMKDDGQMEVRISVSNLMDISHMFKETSEKIWLVIDTKTKYQSGILRAIRKKEIQKAISDQQDFFVEP